MTNVWRVILYGMNIRSRCYHDFIRRQQCFEILESDIVAVGTIINDKPELLTQEQRYDAVSYLSRLLKIINLEVIILYYLP